MAQYEVNIDLANETKKNMADALKTDNANVLNKIGAFSSLYDAKFAEYKHPIMVLKTEEPGSKQLLCAQYNKMENVCYDMINHLINDCIMMGATPLTVQDAIICGKLEKDIVGRIVTAIADACKAQECVLTGGETSEQPGVLSDGTYILTSSIVGIVEKDEIIDGSKIAAGDVVISLPSSGIHTNGLTLVRRIMREVPAIMNETIDGGTFINAVLEPHRCYYMALKDTFKGGDVVGLAHITGGGIKENLNRVLPKTLCAEIDLSAYRINEVFKALRKFGEIDDAEMLRTFNLGCGVAVVAKKSAEASLLAHFKEQGLDAYRIGVISPSEENGGSVITKGSLQW